MGMCTTLFLVIDLVLMWIMSEADGDGNGNDDTDANDDTKE